MEELTSGYTYKDLEIAPRPSLKGKKKKLKQDSVNVINYSDKKCTKMDIEVTVNIESKKELNEETKYNVQSEIVAENSDASSKFGICSKLASKSVDVVKKESKEDNEVKLESVVTKSNLRINYEQNKKGCKAKLTKNYRNVSRKESVGKLNKDEIRGNLLDDDISDTSFPLNKETVSQQTDKIIQKIEKKSNSPKLDVKKILANTAIMRNCIKSQVKPLEFIVISQILSENCYDELKNIIDSAIQYKELWGRKKLTAGDVNKALIFSGEEELSDFIDFNLPPQKKISKIVNFSEKFVLKSKVSKAESSGSSKSNIYITGAWMGNKDLLSKNFSKLPSKLKTYFDVITKAILNSNSESCSIALEDLKLNSNIFYLVPYFVEFIATEVLKVISDFPRLPVLLKAIHCLLSNPCLYFEQNSHLNTLAYLLLKCVLHPWLHFHLTWDEWFLKDTIGMLLSHVLNRNESKKLFLEVMFVLEATLCDTQRPLICHYGVLFALNSIGVPAIKLVLLPHIDEYLEYLNSVDASNYQEQCNLFAVKGQLKHSYYLLISDFLKSKVIESPLHRDRSEYHHVFEETKESEIQQIVSSFSEYFDDSLSMFFPSLNLISCDINNKEKKPQNSVKFRIHSKVRNLVLKKSSTEDSNLNIKSKMSVFDHHPIKKHVIKFGDIKKHLSE